MNFVTMLAFANSAVDMPAMSMMTKTNTNTTNTAI
jgi:hypothetical protein